MNDKDFAIIAQTLSVIVPAEYRRLMSPYPFGEDSVPAEAYVPNDAEYVCEINEQCRDDDLWRPYYFAIGTTRAGDAFVLDTNADDSPVFKLSHYSRTVTEVAETLDSWFAKLKKWYIEFDSDQVAAEYAMVAVAVHAAGFFTTSPEPMDGWHRISVASKIRPQGGLTGNSFWIAHIRDSWFVGAWGGFIYRIQDSIDDFCVAWLTYAPNGTSSDFAEEFKSRFRLQAVTDKEFEGIAEAD